MDELRCSESNRSNWQSLSQRKKERLHAYLLKWQYFANLLWLKHNSFHQIGVHASQVFANTCFESRQRRRRRRRRCCCRCRRRQQWSSNTTQHLHNWKFFLPPSLLLLSNLQKVFKQKYFFSAVRFQVKKFSFQVLSRPRWTFDWKPKYLLSLGGELSIVYAGERSSIRLQLKELHLP